MADRDPLERLTKMWEKQREALEEAFERLQKTGRRVAESVAEVLVDAVRRVTPGDDPSALMDRLEAQQKEVFTRLSEAQRDAVERIIDASRQANEAMWRSVRSLLSDLPRADAGTPPKKSTEATQTSAPVSREPAADATSKPKPAKKAPAKKAPAKKST